MKITLRTLGVAVIAALALGAVIGPYGIAGGYGGPGPTRTPTPGSGYGGGSGLRLAISATTQKYSAVKANGIKVKANTGDAACSCKVIVKAVRNGVLMGRGTRTDVNGMETVTVKLTTKGRNALKGASVTFKLKAHSEKGTATSATALGLVKLKR